jgi:DNA-binding CsgD family transcriptional regulator
MDSIPVMEAFAVQLPLPVARIDATGRCTWLNQAWLNFTGRNEDQELGYGWLEGVHRSHRNDLVGELLTAAREQRLRVERRVKLSRPGSDAPWVTVSFTAVHDGQGTCEGFFGFIELGATTEAPVRPTLGEGGLSHRERQVAALVASGLDNAGIGGRLGLSARTVRAYLSSMYRKLGLHNRTQLALWAAGCIPTQDAARAG